MAKVPSGKTAANWDGAGAVWFKIWEEKATFTSAGPKWTTSQGKHRKKRAVRVWRKVVPKTDCRSSRCGFALRRHSQVPCLGRIPAACRASRPARRLGCRRCSVLRGLCPDQRERRWKQDRLGQQSRVVPGGIQPQRPGHPLPAVLAHPDELPEPWTGCYFLLRERSLVCAGCLEVIAQVSSRKS